MYIQKGPDRKSLASLSRRSRPSLKGWLVVSLRPDSPMRRPFQEHAAQASRKVGLKTKTLMKISLV